MKITERLEKVAARLDPDGPSIRDTAGLNSFAEITREVRSIASAIAALEAGRSGEAEPVAWIVFDTKGIRFTLYNRELAEAIAERGLLVLPMLGRYEWFDAKADEWKPINRLPYTWERELGIPWRAAAPQQPTGRSGEAVYRCDFCGSDYTSAKYCCQRRREYLNAYGDYESAPQQPPPVGVPQAVRDALEWYASDPSVWVSHAPDDYDREFKAANESPYLTRIEDDRRGHPQFVPNERKAEEALQAWDEALSHQQPPPVGVTDADELVERMRLCQRRAAEQADIINRERAKVYAECADMLEAAPVVLGSGIQDLRASLRRIVRLTEKLDDSCEDCYVAACIANGALARSESPAPTWPAADRLLSDAYAAGMNGDEFDMLAAREKLSRSSHLPLLTDAMVRRAVHAYDAWMLSNQPNKDDAFHDGMHAALTAALGHQQPAPSVSEVACAGCGHPGQVEPWCAPCRKQHIDDARESAGLEAAIFRWLTEDIADPEERKRRNAMLKRMPTMSYAAVCQQINHEWALAAQAGQEE